MQLAVEEEERELDYNESIEKLGTIEAAIYNIAERSRNTCPPESRSSAPQPLGRGPACIMASRGSEGGRVGSHSDHAQRRV